MLMSKIVVKWLLEMVMIIGKVYKKNIYIYIYISNVIMEQSNVNAQNIDNSCLDLSNSNGNSNVQSEVLNSSVNALGTVNMVTNDKNSSSGPQVAKSGGPRVKSHGSGSSSSAAPPPRVRCSPRVRSQKGRSRHISDTAAAAALSSIPRHTSGSDCRALQHVFSKKWCPSPFHASMTLWCCKSCTVLWFPFPLFVILMVVFSLLSLLFATPFFM